MNEPCRLPLADALVNALQPRRARVCEPWIAVNPGGTASSQGYSGMAAGDQMLVLLGIRDGSR